MLAGCTNYFPIFKMLWRNRAALGCALELDKAEAALELRFAHFNALLAGCSKADSRSGNLERPKITTGITFLVEQYQTESVARGKQGTFEITQVRSAQDIESARSLLAAYIKS